MSPAGTAFAVMKFGGTSVRDAAAMRGVVGIVETERAASGRLPIVVTSACAGITDRLLACARAAGSGDHDALERELALIRRHHEEVLRAISPVADLPELEHLLGDLERLTRGMALLRELTPRMLDAVASFGERLSSLLLSALFDELGWSPLLVDSREIIITDDRHTEARPLLSTIEGRIEDRLLPELEQHDVVVAQGFIGGTRDGVTTTIGRGGSDHSGALYAAAIGADEVQIWTDVSGIMTADPRLVPSACVVPRVTFAHARELAWYGAKVIHPETVVPAVERGIAVVIRNTMRPSDPGTRILADDTLLGPSVDSIVLRRSTLLLALRERSAGAGGDWLAEVLGALESCGARLYTLQLAESGATLVLDEECFDDRLRTMIEARCHIVESRPTPLLCLSGERMHEAPELLAPALEALRSTRLRLLSLGARSNVALFGVEPEHALDALRSMHRELFERGVS